MQLDLLANAEARHPSLRRRHTEQLALIVEVDRLVTAAVWLVNDARDWATAPNEEIQRQLLAIALECSRLADALASDRQYRRALPLDEAMATVDGQDLGHGPVAQGHFVG